MEQIAVNIIDVTLGYKPAEPIFGNFSVEAYPGELVALVGRNGVGKSTLIKTINGLLSPLTGDVQIFGNSVKSMHRHQRAKLLSYVPAEPVRVANLCIRDFVAVARFPYVGWSNSLSNNDWEMVHYALSLVGIEDLASRDITTVSDGERQRAMIAFALAQDTKVILLDEPTAFLDLPNKYEMVRLLSHLAHQRQKSIVYSTHDLQGAMHEADIIWMMLESGFISGAPEDLALSKQFDRLLDNTQVEFDIKTGQFKNARTLDKVINVEGSDMALNWTKRMLQRLGYRPIADGECKLKVVCSNNEDGLEWSVFDGHNLVLKSKSIEELSRKLRSLKNDI